MELNSGSQFHTYYLIKGLAKMQNITRKSHNHNNKTPTSEFFHSHHYSTIQGINIVTRKKFVDNMHTSGVVQFVKSVADL